MYDNYRNNNFQNERSSYDWDRLKKFKYSDSEGNLREQLITEDALRISNLLKSSKICEYKDYKGEKRFKKLKEGLTASQLRQFYGEVKGLELRLEENGGNFKEVYPFILMLKPKIDYKHNRQVIITEFKKFIDTNVDIIKEENKNGNGYKAFTDFCLFFECVVGYFPKTK